CQPLASVARSGGLIGRLVPVSWTLPSSFRFGTPSSPSTPPLKRTQPAGSALGQPPTAVPKPAVRESPYAATVKPAGSAGGGWGVEPHPIAIRVSAGSGASHPRRGSGESGRLDTSFDTSARRRLPEPPSSGRAYPSDVECVVGAHPLRARTDATPSGREPTWGTSCES